MSKDKDLNEMVKSILSSAFEDEDLDNEDLDNEDLDNEDLEEKVKFFFVDEGQETGDTVEVYTIDKNEIKKWAKKDNIGKYELIELLSALKGDPLYDNNIINRLDDAIFDKKITVSSVDNMKVVFDDNGDVVEPANAVGLYLQI